MRTTIDLDEDVLVAVKALSRAQRRTLGQVLSDVARQGILHRGSKTLQPEDTRTTGGNAEFQSKTARLAELGVRPFAYTNGLLATNELVNKIRNQEGI